MICMLLVMTLLKFLKTREKQNAASAARIVRNLGTHSTAVWMLFPPSQITKGLLLHFLPSSKVVGDSHNSASELHPQRQCL
jgi:hypothetical protein